MYELLVLSLLMHWPLHAYRVAKIANEIIGPEEQISTGTLSSLLAKLERAGLISPADPGTAPFPGDRPSRVFAITTAGREHFLAHCRQILRSKQTDAQDVAGNPLKQKHMSAALREGAMALMRLKTEQWQLELAWGQALRAQTLLRFEQRGEALAAP